MKALKQKIAIDNHKKEEFIPSSRATDVDGLPNLAEVLTEQSGSSELRFEMS